MEQGTFKYTSSVHFASRRSHLWSSPILALISRSRHYSFTMTIRASRPLLAVRRAGAVLRPCLRRMWRLLCTDEDPQPGRRQHLHLGSARLAYCALHPLAPTRAASPKSHCTAHCDILQRPPSSATKQGLVLPLPPLHPPPFRSPPPPTTNPTARLQSQHQHAADSAVPGRGLGSAAWTAFGRLVEGR